MQACLCNHEVAMSAKALCSPQEAIWSQQLPFQELNTTIVFEAYQIDPLPEISIDNRIEMIFLIYIIKKLEFSQSGYNFILYFLCLLN